MAGNKAGYQFRDLILKQMQSDWNTIASELATFVNEQVIDRHWKENFPGHELTPETIKRKGNKIIGVRTGALRRAATLWTTWSVYPFVAGGVRPLITKSKHGLTAYSNMVRTKIGGELDYLSLDARDIVNIQSFLASKFRAKNYISNGTVRVINKGV